MFSTPVGRCCWLALLILLAPPVAAGAEVAGGEVVLAQNAHMTLTRADYDAALARLVPEERRPDFESRPKFIDSLLNALVVRKTLAAEARDGGLDREPMPPGADADTVLEARMLNRLDVESRADFDRRVDAFTAKAREDYLVSRRNYVTPEEFAFSQIYVDFGKRGEEEALRIAEKIRSDLAGGADFAETARARSEDAAAAATGGKVGWRSRADIDPRIVEALSAVDAVGGIGTVVRTGYGCYVVRLDGRRPGRQLSFDEVKAQILARLEAAHVQARRAAKVDAIYRDPGLRVNQPAIDALLIRRDPEAIRRALQALPPAPPPN